MLFKATIKSSVHSGTASRKTSIKISIMWRYKSNKSMTSQQQQARKQNPSACPIRILNTLEFTLNCRGNTTSNFSFNLLANHVNYTMTMHGESDTWEIHISCCFNLIIHLSKFFVQLEWLETPTWNWYRLFIRHASVLWDIQATSVRWRKWWDAANLNFKDISFFWLTQYTYLNERIR